MPSRIFTVGHSNLPLASFLDILAGHRIEALADIRAFPASRRHPHFAGEALAESVRAAGVDYRWFPALGGRRKPRRDSPHTAWRVAGFRAYADYMDAAEFEQALAELLQWASTRRAAVMCAEKLWWQCHRRLLADRLVARGIEVEHALDPGRTEPHRLSAFARRVGDRLVYDAGAQIEIEGG